VIPKVIHRIAIGPIPEDAERFWKGVRLLHPGWELKTWTSLDPADWPQVGSALKDCAAPAQQADLMRLEVLEREGGIYLDWDMELYRPLDVFLPLDGFAACDAMSGGPTQKTWIGTGILGFRPHHPAIQANLALSLRRLRAGRPIMQVGPFATTEIMRDRDDVLLLPRLTFYGWDHRDREAIKDGALSDKPWAYGLHRMHGSWARPPRKETKLW
jgi:hypothetical protein